MKVNKTIVASKAMMRISEMMSENKAMIYEQLEKLYRAHDSMKGDWRFSDLNAHREKRIKELEDMRDYYENK